MSHALSANTIRVLKLFCDGQVTTSVELLDHVEGGRLSIKHVIQRLQHDGYIAVTDNTGKYNIYTPTQKGHDTVRTWKPTPRTGRKKGEPEPAPAPTGSNPFDWKNFAGAA